MIRNLVLFCSLLLCFQGFAQVQGTKEDRINQLRQQGFSPDSLPQVNSGTTNVLLNGTTKYTDFKIISFLKDTTYIDTTLTIQKHYRFNFRRKDNFGLLPFHNIGQTFNTLAYSFNETRQYPDIGFRAKQFFYLDAEDIDYYDVPTPTSEIMFMTTFEQGQFLESFFTLNFSKRFNASIEYTGLRSLGKYRRSLVSQGNFRTTFRYQSKEGQYSLRGHIATQDLLNEESGGLTDIALQSFISNDENFTDRARLDVNLTTAENSLEGSRVYVEHDYKLLGGTDKKTKAKKNANNTKKTPSLNKLQDSLNVNRPKDSLGLNKLRDSINLNKRVAPKPVESIEKKNFSNLKIGHTFLTEGKFYEFRQTSPSSLLGTINVAGAQSDRVESTFVKNEFFLEFNSKYVLGTFRVKSALMNYTYGYNEIFNQAGGLTIRKLEGDGVSFGADWKAKVKNIELDASGEIVPGNGRLSGTNLKGNLSYKKDSLFTVKASLLLNSRAPNFNFLLHQSIYNEFNWYNPDFDNIRTQDLGFQLESKWLNAQVNLTNIENFTYFGENANGNIAPLQSSENVTYLKVQAAREFKLGKFALDNTILYQNVSGGSSVFRVPELVTRSTLYFADYAFKGDPVYVQIGTTFNYFSNFMSNAYNPVLAEFVLQNDTEIGFPRFDVFLNAQIQRTRIYFRFDNISSMFFQKNYFSAPNYPYRDSVFRFGLVWNWFI